MFFPSNIKLLPFSRFAVCDRSMEPAILDGDHVLTFNWIKPKVKDVIVFQSGKIYKIKRVIKTSADLIFVAGDNKEFSTKEKPVKKRDVVGKVIAKY